MCFCKILYKHKFVYLKWPLEVHFHLKVEQAMKSGRVECGKAL